MKTNIVPERNLETASRYNFDQTLDRLKQSIQAENLLLIHEINTQQIVKTAGIEINGLRQLLFFHPRYMKVVLDHNPAAVVEAPLKFAVVEDDHQAVVVRYADPEYLFNGYAGLEALRNELSVLVSKILAAITQ
jgi:uncharacterized protein (DUF302 family)